MIVSENERSIILENEFIRFSVGKNGKALSLILKCKGEDVLADSETSLFSISQDRFFDNELKLMHPARQENIQSDSIRYENGSLIAGFSPLPYEAVINITDGGSYLVFTLSDFVFPEKAYSGLSLAKPPANAIRFLQLHLRNRKYFGEWMNVCHDDSIAVAVMGTKPQTFIGNEETKDGKLLFAEARKGILFKGCSAVLLAGEKNSFLDKADKFEKDFSLPRGVNSRRSDKINASVYWVYDATPDNISKHIKYAAKGGFSMMLFYYTCFVKEVRGYSLCGNYELRDEYKNGLSDIKKMLDELKSRGITPGLHFLHSHIGINSKYFTPEADHRIMLRQPLTLSDSINERDTTIFVDNYPFETELPENCRILRFGTELIHYESCSDTAPYCYTGCVRGFNGTKAQSHPKGCGGGVVFMSEYGATSGYCDQNSSLQDEIAEKIADIYNQGFEFVYMDGSEGVNAPYEYQVPFAQYRVYKKFNTPPLFCEAAAKGHFSWHMLSGGNAFDIFGTDIFKAMINKYPLKEAPDMRMDFTRINFGWWGFFEDSRPDVFEYGTSHAAGSDCPVTIQSNLEAMKKNARLDDNLEVFRRWEDVRRKKLLSEEQKEMIREPDREFTLLLSSAGKYELKEYFPVKTPVPDITVYCFRRQNKTYAVLCHNTGEAGIFIPVKNLTLRDEVEGNEIKTEKTENGTIIYISGRSYLETELTTEELKRAFANAKTV